MEGLGAESTRNIVEEDTNSFMDSFEDINNGEMEENDMVNPDYDNEEEEDGTFWGTTVSFARVQKECHDFITTFTKDNDDMGDDEDEDEDEGGMFYYIQLLADLADDTEKHHIDLDYQDIVAYSHSRNINLAYEMKAYPAEVIEVMDSVVNDLFQSLLKEKWEGISLEMYQQANRAIHVRPFHLDMMMGIRELSPQHINTLQAVSGIVIRSSQVMPELEEACFICTNPGCYGQQKVRVRDGHLDQPGACTACQSRNTMTLSHNLGDFTDKQLVRLQETPDTIPKGETPFTLNLWVYGKLYDSVKPGDRVVATGVYRTEAKRINPRKRTVRSIYRTYLNVLHFQKVVKSGQEEGSVGDSWGDGDAIVRSADGRVETITERDIRMLRLSHTPNLYDELVRALAPSIWEMEDVKKGLLCQLFGGQAKNNMTEFQANRVIEQWRDLRMAEEMDDDERYRWEKRVDAAIRVLTDKGIHERHRAEINVLLCGDPGTSKSQLLGYVHKLAPRGIYTSGKGSSAVGLTAYVTKDSETKELVLESGALVLSDCGICCIDEFDKMSDSSRTILHEAMEQQTVSVAKGGIVCTLNARTSILASANPVESRYNPKKSVVENIQLGPTLLSRFDLIYLVLDKPDKSSDSKLAHHLISLYQSAASRKKLIPRISIPELADYISWTKEYFDPHIPGDMSGDAVRQRLSDIYVEMRNSNGVTQQSSKKVITATPRQLDSIIRISVAIARMHARDIVELDDVNEAYRLMKASTQQAAINPETGAIDMDNITTGISSDSRQLVKELGDILEKEMMNLAGQTVDFGNLKDGMGTKMSRHLSDKQMKNALQNVESQNFGVYQAVTIIGIPKS